VDDDNHLCHRPSTNTLHITITQKYYSGRSAATIESELLAERDRAAKLAAQNAKPPNSMLVLLDLFVEDSLTQCIRNVVYEVHFSIRV